MLDVLTELPKIEIEQMLFERGAFDFITDKEGVRHQKQFKALCLLTDQETVELCYGGAAGGAKSWTGCTWLLFMCLCYPDTRWFIGREELKRLRESTLITFFKVAKAYGAVKETDWKYHGQDHYIQFANGSRIDLLDLKYMPSDPLYERYGSIEYTGGWIEEAGEVDFAAYDTLKSRIGRHNNDKHGLIRKLLITCNPKKNWLYKVFYKAWREKALPVFRKFLQVFYTDNPYLESGYEEALRSINDQVKRERLKDGNWEYSDDPTTLVDYDSIMDCFTNEHVQAGDKFISADLAMKGRDRFVAAPWSGLICDLTKGVDKLKSGGKEIETDVKYLMINNSVPRSQVIVDSDGLGSYLESYLTGIKEFHGGGRAVDEKEFANIKSECGYKLAEVVNKKQLRIICSMEQRERIAEELGVLKADNVDADEKKKRIIKKEQMKEILGRSPDYLDMLLMRMYFELKPKSHVKKYANAFH